MSNSLQELFRLPSDGKVYDREVEPDITLRSMTTMEEKKRLGNSVAPYKLLASIIDDCIIDKPEGFTSYDLVLGDFQYLLFKLRTVTYGKLYKLNLRCPSCGQTFEAVVDLDELEELRFDESMLDQLSITLPMCGQDVTLRMLTPHKLDQIERRAADILAKRPEYEGSPSYILTLMNEIDTVDGEKLVEAKKQRFVENLYMKDARAIQKAVDSIKLGVNTQCTQECPKCKHSFRFQLPFTSSFLGPED